MAQAAAQTQASLLAAARGGDTKSFADLVMPHRRALHVHCYRMLGSLVEASEVTSEALFRARRGLRGYQAERPLHPWLLRITTVACLRADSRRTNRPRDLSEVARLQPYPDALLDRFTAAGPDPAAEPTGRDTIALPFVEALQLLPAAQRAAVVLHDVLSWSFLDVARALAVPAATAVRALERARETLATVRSTGVGPSVGHPADNGDLPASAGNLPACEQRILAAFLHAWRAGDTARLADTLSDEVILVMRPGQIRRQGSAAVAAFLAEPTWFEVIQTRANGQPALAVYRPHGVSCQAWALMVLTMEAGRIAAVNGFEESYLFDMFGLPLSR